MYSDSDHNHNIKHVVSEDSFNQIIKNLNDNYDPIIDRLKAKGYIIASSLRRVILIKDREHCATISAEPFNIVNKFPVWYTKSEDIFQDICEIISDQYTIYDARRFN